MPNKASLLLISVKIRFEPQSEMKSKVIVVQAPFSELFNRGGKSAFRVWSSVTFRRVELASQRITMAYRGVEKIAGLLAVGRPAASDELPRRERSADTMRQTR